MKKKSFEKKVKKVIIFFIFLFSILVKNGLHFLKIIKMFLIKEFICIFSLVFKLRNKKIHHESIMQVL